MTEQQRQVCREAALLLEYWAKKKVIPNYETIIEELKKIAETER